MRCRRATQRMRRLRGLAFVATAFVSALLMGASSVHACSLAGGYDYGDHGLFHVKSLDTHENVTSIRVEGRSLGASCELSNRAALNETHIVWADRGPTGSRDSVAIRSQALDNEEPTTLHHVTGRFTAQLAIHDRHVHHVTNVIEPDEGSGKQTLRTLVYSIGPNGSVTEHDLDVDRNDPVLGGGWVAWTDVTRGQPSRFWAYDLGSQAYWSLTPTTLLPGSSGDGEGGNTVDLLGLPDDARVRAVTPKYAIFHVPAEDAHWVYDLGGRKAYDITGKVGSFQFRMYAEGDTLYIVNGDTGIRMSLPDGAPQRLPGTFPEYGGPSAIGGGYYALGQFATGPPNQTVGEPSQKPGAAAGTVPLVETGQHPDGAPGDEPADDGRSIPAVAFPGGLLAVLLAGLPGRAPARRGRHRRVSFTHRLKCRLR